jgi:hypothetical protein
MPSRQPVEKPIENNHGKYGNFEDENFEERERISKKDCPFSLS